MSAVWDPNYPVRPDCFNSNTNPCPATTDMLAFLNITTTQQYLQAYCLNPPADSCAFDFCPNPDIAGLGIRISTYVTNICLAILILHDQDQILPAFWAQILTTYSYLITAVIAIQQKSLTRLHATFAQATVASPLTIYMVIYAVRSCFPWKEMQEHRMAMAVGNGRLLGRVLVLACLPFWVTLTIFIYTGSERMRFSQPACDIMNERHGRGFFYFPPLRLTAGPWYEVFALVSPLILLVFMWTLCIFLQRHRIWTERPKDQTMLYTMWRQVNDNYPLVQFYTIVLVPFTLWCGSLELGVRPADNKFTPTFGQIIPLFVALPPAVSVLLLVPRLGFWFWDLAWVRYITGKRLRRAKTRVYSRAGSRSSYISLDSVKTAGTTMTPTTERIPGVTPGVPYTQSPHAGNFDIPRNSRYSYTDEESLHSRHNSV